MKINIWLQCLIKIFINSSPYSNNCLPLIGLSLIPTWEGVRSNYCKDWNTELLELLCQEFTGLARSTIYRSSKVYHLDDSWLPKIAQYGEPHQDSQRLHHRDCIKRDWKATQINVNNQEHLAADRPLLGMAQNPSYWSSNNWSIETGQLQVSIHAETWLSHDSKG